MSLFVLFSILFGWSEYYHMINKHLLYNRQNKKSLTDLFYFFVKFVYGVWIIIGLFTYLKVYFAVLLLISIIRYPIMWFGDSRLLFFYEMINTPVSIMLLMVILGFGLF